MTDCESARERLLAYHDGELPVEARRAVEAHLLACARCAQEAALIDEALQRVQALPVPEPSAGFWDTFDAEVRQRVAEERPPRLPWWVKVAERFRGLAPLRPVPVLAAAMALGLLLAVGLLRTHRAPHDLPPLEALAVGEDLAIGQNLELLESLDLLEEIDVLERLDVLRQFDPTGRPRVS
ncbi:MAG: anti-sigma factor family protein [Candidatus Methylomirabilales bacterium]